MKLNPETLEDTSVHYFVPAPRELQSMLYYPISIGYFDCKPCYAVQRNIHNSFLLMVMMAGTLGYQTRQQRGTLRVGQALLLDCSQPHSYQAQDKCSFTFIHFDGAQSREICEQINRSCGNCIRLTDSTRMHELVGELLSYMRDDRRVNEAQTSAMLYSILMTLLESSGVSGDGAIGNSIVDQAIGYIQTHLADPLTVETIASSVGYSPSYFSHVFQRETGLSPYRFVVKSRMDSAMQLLQTTRLSIQDIAFQVGFNSVANFCYAFRREKGLSPNECRKRPV